MFVLRPNDTFDWTVKARVPEKGKRVGLSFTATFNLLEQSVVEELIVDPETRDSGKFLEQALVSFTGFDVEDEEGNKITDDDDRNSAIRRSTLFIDPLIKAYSDGVAGSAGKN